MTRDADSGQRGARTAMVLAMGLYRGYGLAQVAVAVALDWNRYLNRLGVVALLVALAVDNLVLILMCVRRRRVLPGPVSADTMFNCLALFAGAWLVAGRDSHNWAYFMYPLTLVTSIAIGFAYRHLATVLAMTSLPAAAYLAAAATIHGDPAWVGLPNALSFHANTIVAWAVARYLTGTGRRLDRARAEAVAHADYAAKQQLRARHARALHDRALQTLESLACGPWITDQHLRAHVAAEAAWLRGFVEDTGHSAANNLLDGLHDLVQRNALMGLTVDLAATALRDGRHPGLEPPTVQTLLDAIGEALTNVRKHAGVDRARIRAHFHHNTVNVTVTDQGTGFDATASTTGLGLRSSITGRLTEIGGSATIDSSPGNGTVIRLTAPTIHDSP